MTASTERRLLVGLAATVYLLVYFSLNHEPEGGPARQLETAFDRAMPFQTAWIYVYSLAYPCCLTPAFVVGDRARFRTVAAAFVISILLAGATFVVLPVTMPRPAIPAGATGRWLLELTWRLDGPYNCFPSLHVGLDVLAAICCFGTNGAAGLFVGILAALITLSTMLVKQHFVLDAVGGVLLAVVSVLLAESAAVRHLLGGAPLSDRSR